MGKALLSPPRAVHVLQVSAYFAAHGGGIEVVADQLARALAVQGIQVCWMAGGGADDVPSDLPTGATAIRGQMVELLERRFGLPAPVWALSSIRMLWRQVRAADVVHIHDYLYMPTLLAAVFAGLAGKPLLVTQHIGAIPYRGAFARHLLDALNRTLGRLILGRAAAVAFVGRPVQGYFERFVPFRRPPLLIPNGVDHQRFRPLESRTSADQRPLRLLFVGRFVEKKGLLLLRQALDLPDIHWTFVGWGPLSPLHWPDRPDNVTVLDKLSPAEVARQYQAADLLVLPSQGEGFPLVVQEALACGTPVLVSREVAEAFPQTDSACVFDVELRCSEPSRALRARLAEVSARPAALAQGRHAAQALAQQWSWRACADRYSRLYAELTQAVR